MQLEEPNIIQGQNQEPSELDYFNGLNVTIRQVDINVVAFLFWTNMILTTVGFAIYWYTWPLSIVCMLTVSLYLFGRVKHTKNQTLTINAGVFGILSAASALTGWIVIISSYRAITTVENVHFFYAIFMPISIIFCIIYLVLSSIALLDMKSRYDKYLTEKLIKEINTQNLMESNIQHSEFVELKPVNPPSETSTPKTPETPQFRFERSK